MLYLPAIHKFIEPAPNWGFHRFTELWYAANNLWELKGMLWMTPISFFENFIHWHGGVLRSGEPLNDLMISKLTTVRDFKTPEVGMLVPTYIPALSDQHWQPIYVPAGWGMCVLKLISIGGVRADIIPVQQENCVQEVAYDKDDELISQIVYDKAKL